MTVEVPTNSRNIDELKRLVVAALDKNGVLADLRQTVKLHVSRAINDETSGSVVHQRNPKIAALMATERGELLTELVVEFLRFYDLKDSLSMLLVEASLPRLRPSEAELAGQCGCSYSPTIQLSVLEQYLTKHADEVHYAPQHEMGHTEFDIRSPDREIAPAADVPVVSEFAEPVGPLANDSSLDESPRYYVPQDTSVENDMVSMRKISHEMERISLSSGMALLDTSNGVLDEPSPRYEDDFDAASSGGSSPLSAMRSARRIGEEPDDMSNTPYMVVKRRQPLEFGDPDAVLFESRESPLRELGEFSARMFPLDANDHVEDLDRRPVI